jgi:Smg protein
LTAAGFEADDIEDALEWLAALQARGVDDAPLPVQGQSSVRQFAGSEAQKIDVAGRGYLHFLEAAGVVDAAQRELAIDRIMALPGAHIGLEQVKLIVLMVLWTHGSRLDALIVEELLASERSVLLH